MEFHAQGRLVFEDVKDFILGLQVTLEVFEEAACETALKVGFGVGFEGEEAKGRLEAWEEVAVARHCESARLVEIEGSKMM